MKKAQSKYANKDYYAKLLVIGLREMDKRKVKRLTTWLRNLADDFEITSRDDYANNFTARLMK